MKFIVYDHKGSEGALQGWAKTEEDISLATERNVDKAVAVLLSSDADVMFVHLDDDSAWNRLINHVTESKAVFRLSSVGFAPTKPVGKGQNCFHVIPPTTGSDALSSAQLTEFRNALTKEDVLAELRAGQIPGSIRSFIWFEEPYLARSLHILLQAMLAQWAAETGHPLRDQAVQVLGCRGNLPSFSRQADWALMLRKMLGSVLHNGRTIDTSPTDAKLTEVAMKKMHSELSIKEDSSGSLVNKVETVIQKILQASPSLKQDDQKQADARLFPLVKSVYEYLDAVCSGQRKEGV